MKGFFTKNRKEYERLKSDFMRTRIGKELQVYMLLITIMIISIFAYEYSIDYMFNDTLAICVLIFGIIATLYRMFYNKYFFEYCKQLDNKKEV